MSRGLNMVEQSSLHDCQVRSVTDRAASPHPEEADVHLSVCLHNIRMDFAACVTAAFVFVQEFRVSHYTDTVVVLPGETAGLPRLPNERLYLEP
ncbi:hypothetical protein AB0H71_09295 [Nocardia sp. NPDC050697]|uniref:hypothetical protein n=1 Tax=Nocardia sp. NPDC050697 TaxID=3155158 RepID=UPI0033CDAF80